MVELIEMLFGWVQTCNKPLIKWQYILVPPGNTLNDLCSAVHVMWFSLSLQS